MTKSWTFSKFKAFADDKINVTQTLKFQDGRVENIAGKGENAGYQHFLLFPQCFQKATFSGSLKAGIVWIKSYHLYVIPGLTFSYSYQNIC